MTEIRMRPSLTWENLIFCLFTDLFPFVRAQLEVVTASSSVVASLLFVCVPVSFSTASMELFCSVAVCMVSPVLPQPLKLIKTQAIMKNRDNRFIYSAPRSYVSLLFAPVAHFTALHLYIASMPMHGDCFKGCVK